MPVTYAPEAERAANRQRIYNAIDSYNRERLAAERQAPVNPYYATSGGWYGPPVYGGPNMLPAAQASGAHYSAPGSREGWIEQGVPPVIYQRSPYATAAFRVTPNPWGGASVAPLLGFPSRYPHVVSGVPMQPGSLALSVAAPYIMRPPAPAAPAARPAAPARRSAGGQSAQKQQPKSDDSKSKTQETTKTQASNTGGSSDYFGTTQLSGGGTLPASVVGSGNVRDMRMNEDLTQQNPGSYMAPPSTGGFRWLGGDPRLGNRAAASIDAMEDLFNYRYNSSGSFAGGRINPFAGQANAGLSQQATSYARNIGLNRDVYIRDAQERAAKANAYNKALQAQRGY